MQIAVGGEHTRRVGPPDQIDVIVPTAVSSASFTVYRSRLEAREIERGKEVRVLSQEQQPVELAAGHSLLLVESDKAVSNQLLLERGRDRLAYVVIVMEETPIGPAAVGWREGCVRTLIDEYRADAAADRADERTEPCTQLRVAQPSEDGMLLDLSALLQVGSPHRTVLKVSKERHAVPRLCGGFDDLRHDSLEDETPTMAKHQNGELRCAATVAVATVAAPLPLPFVALRQTSHSMHVRSPNQVC